MSRARSRIVLIVLYSLNDHGVAGQVFTDSLEAAVRSQVAVINALIAGAGPSSRLWGVEVERSDGV